MPIWPLQSTIAPLVVRTASGFPFPHVNRSVWPTGSGGPASWKVLPWSAYHVEGDSDVEDDTDDASIEM